MLEFPRCVIEDKESELIRGMSTFHHKARIVFVCSALLSSRPALAQFTQQGPKLVGTGAVGATQGASVSLSADGATALVGGPSDNNNAGAAWVWTRSGGAWTQQGLKLVGSGAADPAYQGYSVSLSGDGTTVLVGGPTDNSNAGAVWVWTRSGGAWTQQGLKLVGSGASGPAYQGSSVSLSADGNTALVGGFGDNSNAGAAWVWTRSGGAWTQQGLKLVGSGAAGAASQGISVSLSADGNTALVGGQTDNNPAVGAVWVWTRSGSTWTQQGPKLVGSGAVGPAYQGTSVSLSADGHTAVVGGFGDNSFAGAAWVWTRSGSTWVQQGPKLVGSGAVGHASQGYCVSVSGDGTTALVGGYTDNTTAGAVWVWTTSGGVWTQQGPRLVGSGAVGKADQGTSVSLSADGDTALVGGVADNNGVGAAWVFRAFPSPVSPLPDMDGDGTSDLAVWRGSTGQWTWLTTVSGFDSGTAGSQQWGNQSLGDIPRTGDIDGDGIADLIVWRASTGTWYWLTSSSGFHNGGQQQWGTPGDMPLVADIDGDRKVDLAVWRPSTGTWYWLTSSSGYSYAAQGQKQWGNQTFGDVPLLGNFDGDGKADLAVWRASTDTWYWLTSASGYSYAAAGSQQWGNANLGDVPLLADFDGDGVADLAVWRASTGTWYWLTSSSGYRYAAARAVQWGNASLGDTPIVGDLDGDGLTDLTVWRASTGTWFWLTSSSGYSYAAQRQKQWGG